MKRLVTLVVLGLAAFPAPAQAENDLAQKRLAKLRQSLERLSATGNVAFRTRYQTKDIAREEFYKQRGRTVTGQPAQSMTGALVGDVLFHACDAKHHILTHGRRRLARAGGEWEQTIGRFPDGAPAPFLFDPERFCRVLGLGKLAIAKQTVGTFENKPVEIYTLTFSGEDALRLGRAGVYPDGMRNSSTTTAAMVRGVAIGVRAVGGRAVVGRAAAPAKVERDVDIALFLEPGKGNVLHAKVRFYRPSTMANRAMMGAVRRGGGVEEEDESEEEQDRKPRKLQFKDGLPVRNAKKKVVTEFDITFTDHGAASLPELPAQAKKLLGLTK